MLAKIRLEGWIFEEESNNAAHAVASRVSWF
jgi:hypothetical protein